jgi:hypothetical protein
MADGRKVVLRQVHVDAVGIARNVIGRMLDAEQPGEEDPSTLVLGDAWKDLGDLLDRWEKAPAESSYGTSKYAPQTQQQDLRVPRDAMMAVLSEDAQGGLTEKMVDDLHAGVRVLDSILGDAK